MGVRAVLLLGAVGALGCSAIVGGKLDDKPEPMDAGGVDAGPPPGDSGGADAGPCTEDIDCPGAESCAVTCDDSTGECVPGDGTGAQCGAGVNDRCVNGVCKSLPACSPIDWECPRPCTEICYPTSETMGVCVLVSDLGVMPMVFDGYPCGPLDAARMRGDICFMGTCLENTTLCPDDSGCACNERCAVFAGGEGGAEGGGCVPLPGIMTRPAGSPCASDRRPGTCSRIGTCTMDGL